MAADQSSEKEVLEAESPGLASDLNRSDFDPIYIGGLPASRPIRLVLESEGVFHLSASSYTRLSAPQATGGVQGLRGLYKKRGDRPVQL